MWLTDIRIVLPDGVVERGALRLADGVIAEIADGDAPVAGLSLAGMTIIPGLIDLHGDMLERDIEPRPGAYFPTEVALYELDKRLAGAGITTAFAAVGFAWTKNDLRTQEKATEIIRAIHERRAELGIDLRVHARFEISNPETAPILEALLDARQVDLVSVMDHTPGQGQYKNIQKYVDFMTRWLGFDPESVGDDLIKRVEGAITVKAELPRNWDIVREVTQIAAARGIPIASHDDDTPEKVAQMADFGVTISEFPVSVAAAQAAHARGMLTIMGAPNAYRGESTSGNLSALAAVRAGLVDILATDYFPAALIGAAFKLAADAVLPLHESIKLVSAHPAVAAKLTDRGEIAIGKSADLVVVEMLAHGIPRVRATMRTGHFIYQDALVARRLNESLTNAEQNELFAS
ncbi:MAG: alpha-D-ribose 1-methylphosphonate 5-triphosphate diphosphatase [Chloroflexota bacterium]|nr:alpha-D-ribose 1-methylphosphonate 5-triphosphate diphosphatase [Chloroflexota bacterium]